MMIPLQEVFDKYNIHPKGVIEVGAHWAEEHDEFVRLGIERFVYIEPCKDAFERMVNNVEKGFQIDEEIIYYKSDDGVRLIENADSIPAMFINCACGAEEKEMTMYVSHQNQGMSNSLLKPHLHLNQHPEVQFTDTETVKVIPLDKLLIEKEKYDFLYMDVQGAERDVLAGAIETLKNIKILYTEINRDDTYENCMQIDEMDLFLSQYGFERKETFWPSPNLSWGDAIYIRV